METQQVQQTKPTKQDKPTAHIENWWKVGGILIGFISLHSNQDGFKTNTQATSPLISLNPEQNRAETLNIIYTLGEKAK